MKRVFKYFSLIGILLCSFLMVSACGQNKNNIKIDVVIDNEIVNTVETNSKNNYLLLDVPEKPEDITTNNKINKYFYGWFVDSNFQTPLLETTKFTKNGKIYGKWIEPKIETFEYVVNKGEATITKCNNKEDTVIIVPDFLNSFPVKTIGSSSFENLTQIRKLFINGNSKKIDSLAFRNCTSMEEIFIPDTVSEIGAEAFRNCYLLKTIKLPSNLTFLSNLMFYECSSLENIIIPKSVITIGYNAFGECVRLTNITIPKNVTTICDSAFIDCTNLKNVTISNGITTVGAYAFSGCTSLKNVIVPESVVTIGNSVFSGCLMLKEVIIDSPKVAFNENNFIENDFIEVIYIKDTIENVSSFITSNFEKLEVSDKLGYNKFIKRI